MAAESLGRALVHRNYRLFLLGQGISLIGTWMQQVALSWMLYRLTDSPALLGMISFTTQIPSLILSPLAGVAADRWNRHRALLVTQVLAMIQATLVVIVVYSGGDLVWKLVGLGFLLGVINAFDMPLRQSFLVEMVPDRQHLSNAIALNSSIVNGARLVGPSLAGLIIAAWGESVCFLLNAVSYVAVLGALLAMRDLPIRQHIHHGSALERLHAGMSYAFRFAPLRVLLMLLAVVSFMAMSTSVLIPVFARDILQGGARTQGFLMGANGIGALAAALYLASRKSVLGLGRAILLATVCYGVSQIAFSFSDRLPLSLPIMALSGFCMMLQMASTNTLIQTITEEDKRGRVMSLYAMAFTGVAPLGSLFGGAMAAQIGAPATVRLCGTCCIAAGIAFGLQIPRMRKLVRPIYEAAGILPKPVSAITPIES
ncbi:MULTISPECIES: MFS transporter [unclassified Schlesneria]|uniref:MFS transporter n=1 Tax=unclassified Schlesneria TaxID=2762017 RepID=UPI002EE897BC